MTNGLQFGSIYILMAAMLLAGLLMSRRGSVGRAIAATMGWTIVLAAGFLLFTFRDDLDFVTQRLRSEAVGAPVQQGDEIRVPMAVDGHFWVDAEVNGERVKFLIDSGATMTTIGQATAERTGVDVSETADQLVRTGNGVVRMSRARAERVELGTIVREDVAMHVAPGEGLNVLGMNFLSSFQRWSVEGRWLILVS